MKISRRELFDKVWAMPMRKLAVELDISDVGLAKACRRNAIPLPGLGYWTKAAYGKAPPKPDLPSFKTDTVVIEAASRRPVKLENPSELAEFPDLQLEINDGTSALGEFALSLQQALSKAKPDAHGFIRCGSSNVVQCEISIGTIDRVVLIVNAIEQNLHKVGGKLIRKRESKAVCIEIEGEHIGLSLSEAYKRSEHQQKNAKYEWMVTKTYTYSFTGMLHLQLDADCRTRKAWNDGVRDRIENKLESFLLGVVAAARGIVQLRQEREAQRLHWEEEHRRYEAEAEVKRQVEFFRTNLIKEANAWKDAQVVREYINHLRQTLANRNKLPAALGAKWLRQADYVVEFADPSPRRTGHLINADKKDDFYGLFGEPLVQ